MNNADAFELEYRLNTGLEGLFAGRSHKVLSIATPLIRVDVGPEGVSEGRRKELEAELARHAEGRDVVGVQAFVDNSDPEGKVVGVWAKFYALDGSEVSDDNKKENNQ